MPLIRLSFAFLIGVLLGSRLHLPVFVWLLLAMFSIISLALPLFFRMVSIRVHGLVGSILRQLPIEILKKWGQEKFGSGKREQGKTKIPFPVLLALIMIGGARWQAAQPEIDPSHVAYYNDSGDRVVVEGIVQQMPDVYDSYIALRVAAERIRPLNEFRHTSIQGLLLARVPVGTDLRYGDRVALEGTLETPPENEDFSYREYLARQDVYSYIPYAQAGRLEGGYGNWFLTLVYSFKGRALDNLHRMLPDPASALLAGITLGVESGIPEDVEEAFRDTGTSHIIAISGFNITIVAALFTRFFGRMFGRKWGAISAAAAIVVYTVLVGADAAVVRAAIMGGLALLARQVGRRQHGLNSLSVTAAVMALINPGVLGDVGFQLSFAATLGLVLYAEPLSQWLIDSLARRMAESNAIKLAKPAADYLLFTLAAQTTTLPVIAYHFRQLSLSSLLANLLILPAQPPIMVLGGLALLSAMAWFPLGQWIAYIAYPFITYTIRAVEWIGQLPGSVLHLGGLAWWWIVAYFLLLLGFTFWGEKIKRWSAKVPAGAAAMGLLLLSSLVWRSVLTAPDRRLHVVVFDVGMGEGVLIQSPEGRFVLVNGGEKASRLSEGLGRWMPLFHHELDFIVVAGAQEEQAAALVGAVRRFPPQQVLWAGPSSASRQVRFLQRTLAEDRIPVNDLKEGQVLDLGQGAALEVLAVGNRGATLLLSWDDFRMLLPLGIDFEGMEQLGMGEEVGPVSALMLAESGYAPINPPQWFANLRPQVVLLSVEAGNGDGLPSTETLTTLQDYTVLRTDRHGWIHITTDGEQMWLEVEHGE